MARLAHVPEQARDMGERAMRMAEERFSVERMADQVLAIYAQLIRTV